MNDTVTKLLPHEERQHRLARDLRAVIDDAEVLLKDVAREAGEGTADARDRLLERLARVRTQIGDAGHVVADRAREAGRATDSFVHEHPWQVLASTAVLAALVGFLAARR